MGGFAVWKFKASSRNSFFRFGFKLSSILLVRMCAPKVHYIDNRG